MSGDITINSDTETISFTVINDFLTEDDESLIFKLFKDSNTLISATSITISDKYKITLTKNSIVEGENFTANITTANVDDTTLYWQLSGNNIDQSDIDGDINGSVDINNNSGSVSITIATDSITEGDETLIFNLYTDSDRTINVANGSLIIQDPPSYNIQLTNGSGDKIDSIDEGSTFNVKIETTNVDAGTSLYYQFTGITANDITNPSQLDEKYRLVMMEQLQ